MDKFFKDVDWELKKKKFWSKVENGANDVKRFYYDHEADIRAAATVAVPIVGLCARQAIKGRKESKELRRKELYHYDRRDDEYYMSRRPLTDSEKIRLSNYYQDGMSKGEALKRMRLLK